MKSTARILIYFLLACYDHYLSIELFQSIIDRFVCDATMANSAW